MAMTMFASFRGYVFASLLLTTAVVSHAVYMKRFFYRAVLFLADSKFAILAVGNMALVSVLLLWRLVQAVFLGPLRFREVERLHMRARDAIIESCFAISVFRDAFNLKFVALVMTLLLLKSMHWLTKDRIEFLEEQPLSPRRTHIRLVGLMSLLLFVDVALTRRFALYTYYSQGPTMFVLFAFEFTVLVIELISDIVRYAFLVVDTSMEGHWEEKGMFSFYIELLSDLCQLTVYVLFFMYVQLHYSFPFHIIRELYMTFHKFQRHCADFLRYRRVVATMNDLFADATEEELAEGDRTCIICREEMQMAKKLACGHIFHGRCLQSWLKRQLSCPTCRGTIDVTGNSNQASRNPQNGGANNQVPNQAGNNANNMNDPANNNNRDGGNGGEEGNGQRPVNIGETGARLMNMANEWWNQVMNDAGAGVGAANARNVRGAQQPPHNQNPRGNPGLQHDHVRNFYVRGPNELAHMQLRARRRGALVQPVRADQVYQNVVPVPLPHPGNYPQHPNGHQNQQLPIYAAPVHQNPPVNFYENPPNPPNYELGTQRVPAPLQSGSASESQGEARRTPSPSNRLETEDRGAQHPDATDIRIQGQASAASSSTSATVARGTRSTEPASLSGLSEQLHIRAYPARQEPALVPSFATSGPDAGEWQANSTLRRPENIPALSEEAVLRSVSLERLLGIQEQVEVLRGEIMELVIAATTAPSGAMDAASVAAVPSESSMDVSIPGVTEEEGSTGAGVTETAEMSELGATPIDGADGGGERDENEDSEAATLRRRRIEFLERNAGN